MNREYKRPSLFKELLYDMFGLGVMFLPILITLGGCYFFGEKANKKFENEDAQNYIKGKCEIELEDVEYMAQNIKKITDIKTSRNNEDLFVTIKGEFKEKVNDSSTWSVIYNVDDIEYSKLMEMKDLKEKIYFVSDYVIPYYEPVDVKISETQMNIGYVLNSEDLELVH